MGAVPDTPAATAPPATSSAMAASIAAAAAGERPTVAGLLRARADAQQTALLFDDQRWSYAEFVAGCAQRAALFAALRRPGPPHIGLLLDNVPDVPLWLGAAALSGAVIVGLNPTRRGEELASDVRHTDCQLIVTESKHAPLLAGLDLGMPAERVLDVDSAAYADALAPHAGAPLPDVEVDPAALYLLLFTSGVSGRPKACRCTQGRLASIGVTVARMFELTEDDVCYAAMPLFHSNGLMAGWCPAVAGGAAVALRRTFSASGFLDDVRRYGATYFNYVGKPLSYILATPERGDDADNPLRRVFGNEGAEQDLATFGRRFGCTVVDGYGSTEGGASVSRAPDMPPGALGRVSDDVTIRDPETGRECAVAEFDADGRLLNADAATGEITSRSGAQSFEGYYNNPEAEAQRVRDGLYWTGDLAYRDAAGWLYFAGRSYDWLRVDGENFAAAPVVRILSRHPSVALAAVYAVPDPDVGDQVMAALQLRPGASFDPEEFATFLAGQRDLGTKWAPRFVRVTAALPLTATSKVLVRSLRDEAWRCDDPVWWRPGRELRYEPLPADEAQRLSDRLAARRPTAPR